MNPKTPHIAPSWLPALLLALLLVPGASCRQTYMPPVIQTNPNLLVVDGIINAGTGSATSITLSRTRKIGDSLGAYTPELQAQLTILGSAGDTYPLIEQDSGIYASAPLSLNPGEKYQLKIITQNGSQYLSDTVPVLASPSIDSLNWQQQGGSGDITVSLNTHDPTDINRYYRWYFTETWEYQAELSGELYVNNGLLYYIDSTTQITTCWRSDNSSDILLGNAASLSQDLISQAPLTTIPRGSQKISVRYSTLVSQYVLTQTAWQYWSTLHKNTQNLGSLFDPQPSQLIGNYHCLSNPNEPVIGYLSAATIGQQRLFIQHSQVNNWDTAGTYCPIDSIPQDPNNYQLYTYNNPAFAPYYLTTTGFIILSSKICLDCRLQGGTTQKPGFW
jgi:hypothetical protein